MIKSKRGSQHHNLLYSLRGRRDTPDHHTLGFSEARFNTHPHRTGRWRGHWRGLACWGEAGWCSGKCSYNCPVVPLFPLLMRRHLTVIGDSHMDLSHQISISNSWPVAFQSSSFPGSPAHLLRFFSIWSLFPKVSIKAWVLLKFLTASNS